MKKRILRRDFLKQSAAGAAAVSLASCTQDWELQPDAGNLPAPPSLAQVEAGGDTLVQVQGPGVPQDLSAALTALLAPLGGLAKFVGKGQSVLLKPNMSFARPVEYRATTTAALIAAVAKGALDAGAKRVVVADFPVSDADEVIAAMGLREALKGLRVEVPLITGDSAFVTRKLPEGKELEEVDYLALALEADVHIAMPIAKSHSSAGFTGALKGAMGLIRSRKSFHWLHDLHQAVVDINTGIRPDLVIMDGLEVMSTDGPKGPGKCIRCDSLIACTDPVAADAAGVRLAPLHGKKVKARQIRHLALAARAGLGQLSLPADRMVHLPMPARPQGPAAPATDGIRLE